VLRQIAEDVPIEKISSAKIQTIISEMKVALESQDDGVAIAAPQLGYPLRMFIVSHRVAGIIRGEKKSNPTDQDTIFINPVIKKLSKEKHAVEEGCLSVRYLYGKVNRAKKAEVVAYDEHGNKFIKGASGLLAQIFQHETDHLNGILFIDKAKHVEEILPEKLEGKINVK